jgi:hypothetical protein
MRTIFTCTVALMTLAAPHIAAAQQASSPGSTPIQQQGIDRTLSTESGKAGTQEPSATSPAAETQNNGVFVNGALNVPGAPKDSQTVPAKFSERNAALDKLPIMAQPLGLTDAQRKVILQSVRAASAPMERRDAKLTEELPATIEAHEFSPTIKSEIPALTNLKYVRLANKVLLIVPANHIVVGQIQIEGPAR